MFLKKYFLTHLFIYYLAVFWCFQGVEKGCIGNKWVEGTKQKPLELNSNPLEKTKVLLAVCYNKWSTGKTFFQIFN